MGISPHMHNLGREFKVIATRPGSASEVPLIWIKDWDFNWQGAYQFARRPVRLPKGSTIKVQAVYDNSAENPKNPNTPPKPVRWGEQTTDEMCLCGVQVFADTISDLEQIAELAAATNWEWGSRAAFRAWRRTRSRKLPRRRSPKGRRPKRKNSAKRIADKKGNRKEPAHQQATTTVADAAATAASRAAVDRYRGGRSAHGKVTRQVETRQKGGRVSGRRSRDSWKTESSS